MKKVFVLGVPTYNGDLIKFICKAKRRENVDFRQHLKRPDHLNLLRHDLIIKDFKVVVYTHIQYMNTSDLILTLNNIINLEARRFNI